MNFENELISGLFVKRYKRFFVDVIIDKKIVTAHCPNTGSMQGLLIKNNKVWLTKSNNPKRKLKYTLQIIESNGSKVGINTHLTNKIVLDELNNNKIKNFKAVKIETEVKFSDNTRFDFLITESNSKKFIEVKNVTLSRTDKLAEFPDAVTSRGAKHINELIKAKTKGYDIYLMFVIQRDDCDQFSIARDIDPKYADLLSDAIKKNLNILCYDCKFSPKGIKLNKQIKIKI
jgi:sugar fermentation stimulation protein A